MAFDADQGFGKTWCKKDDETLMGLSEPQVW